MILPSLKSRDPMLCGLPGFGSWRKIPITLTDGP
jgi:hypothetical protein